MKAYKADLVRLRSDGVEDALRRAFLQRLATDAIRTAQRALNRHDTRLDRFEQHALQKWWGNF